MIKCTHHWMIDPKDYAKCSLCGEEKDFKPLVDKALGCERKVVRRDFHYDRCMVTTGGFHLQGTMNRPIRTTDYRFSADWIE